MDHPRPIRLHFASFDVDLATRQIFENGQEVHMQGKPFSFLATLLRHSGEVVTREAMSHSLWPDIYVQVNQGLNAAARKVRMILRDDALNPTYIETLGSKGYRFIYPVEVLQWSTEAPEVLESPIRVTVLPLKTASPERAVLASGLSRELASLLGRIHPRIRVGSEGDSMSRTGHTEPQGASSDARYVVSGDFDAKAGRVELGLAMTSELEGQEIWQERYEAPAQELSKIIESATQKVLCSFRNLAPVAPTPVFKTGFKAHQEYLKGRHYQAHKTVAELRLAVASFQKAAELDPEFAPAFIGLAEVYNVIGVRGWMQPKAAYIKAYEAAKRALELDERNSEAMIALGWSELTLDRDWAAATRLFERALQMNPNAVMGYCYYAYLLFSRGRADDGVASLKRAARVEPNSLFIQSRLATMYYFARRYDEAIKQARSALVVDPTCPYSRTILGLAYLAQRRYTEALEQMEAAVERANGDPVTVAQLAYAQAEAGRFPIAESLLRKIESQTGQVALPAYHIGLVKLALGNVNEAFQWIEAAYEQCWHWVLLMPQDPRLDILRGTRRYEQLCRMMRPAEPRRVVNSN